MKKLLFAIIIICSVSCGPHRMACGPRGICDTSASELQKKNTDFKDNSRLNTRNL